ncbi:MAG: TonB-dependent receptor plug domain-containing protein, partial [Pseudomonadales bacterium]|nr:TonB-dependent receptor plug domain-containing protein [Pseudomonadales bacterium]
MQQRKFKKKYIITAISTAMLSQLAAAQTDSQAATDEEAQGPVFEEVVVTATRREQTVQEIPFNISAVSGDDIDEAGYVSAAELFRGVPGVSLADGGARNADTNNTITIRGINLDPNATDRLFLTDPTVSTYINNTPTYSNFILKDIARVEVLRGPQSTLYGSGSLGGTVRYILNEPETDFFYGSVTANLSQTDGSDGLNKA